MAQANVAVARVVNVMATGAVAEVKLTKGQQTAVDTALQTIASSSFSFHRITDPKWEPIVRAIERNGIVIVSLQRQVARMAALSFISAWCEGLKKKELTAQEERQAKASASAAFSRAVKTYRKTPKDTASGNASDNTSNGGTQPALSNVVDIRPVADLESVLKLSHINGERLVAFQTALRAANVAVELVEAAGLIAIENSNIRDGIRRVIDMLAPQPAAK